MKIAHISDLHICSRHMRSNIDNTKYLFEHLVKAGYDHIVITGDVTHNARKKDFQILRELLAEFGLLAPHKVSLTIGNHDIYGGIVFAEEVFDFPAKCRNIEYNDKVREFGTLFRETFQNAIMPNYPDIFPYLKIFGDTVLLGINSIAKYSRLKNPFASRGKISGKEYEGIKRLLSLDICRGRTVVVMIHHHFYHHPLEFSSFEPNLWRKIEGRLMKLKGRNRLLKLFVENNVKLILHGHIHNNVDYESSGIRILNSGATFGMDNAEGITYNSITIDAGNIKSNLVSINNSSRQSISNIKYFDIHVKKETGLVAEPAAANI